MTEKQFKILLNKFLHGKASEEEVNLIEKFENIKLDRNKDKVYKSELEKEQLKKELFNSVKPSARKPAYNWLKIAASILVIFGIGYLTYVINRPQLIKISNSHQKPKIILLADGSEITLNQNSEISYGGDFNKKGRNIKLTGEAFFKVAKNPEKPFIINTGNLTTQVVGTEFNIKENKNFVHVTVTEGKVQVFNKKDTLKITKDEQSVYHIASQKLNENKVKAQLFSLWQKSEVQLNNITLMDFSIAIKELYGLPFIFKDKKTKNIPMSISFKKDEPIKDIINRINLINEVKLTLNKKNMIEVNSVE